MGSEFAGSSSHSGRWIYHVYVLPMRLAMLKWWKDDRIQHCWSTFVCWIFCILNVDGKYAEYLEKALINVINNWWIKYTWPRNVFIIRIEHPEVLMWFKFYAIPSSTVSTKKKGLTQAWKPCVFLLAQDWIWWFIVSFFSK